jgi:hypothetical protein
MLGRLGRTDGQRGAIQKLGSPLLFEIAGRRSDRVGPTGGKCGDLPIAISQRQFVIILVIRLSALVAGLDRARKQKKVAGVNSWVYVSASASECSRS